MAESKVSIGNGALQAIGGRRVESFDQDHPNARSLKTAYDGVRKSLLRQYAWGFSIKRASIAADGSQTLWGGWNRYTKPPDFIRLVRDNETGTVVDWRIEGDFIVTADASPLQIRYLADINDPTKYDSLFVEAFKNKLGWMICEDVTGSTSKKAGVKSDYDDAIAEAKRIGAIEKEAQEFPEDEWLTARY